MPDLLSAALMESIVNIDESAMPSTCTVQYQTKTENSRGGSSVGSWLNRNATPMPCRTVPGTVTSKLGAERMQTVGDVVVSIALTAIRAQGVSIVQDDEITVNLNVNLPGNDLSRTERYKVVGAPILGPYSTNLSVPCVKVS